MTSQHKFIKLVVVAFVSAIASGSIVFIGITNGNYPIHYSDKPYMCGILYQYEHDYQGLKNPTVDATNSVTWARLQFDSLYCNEYNFGNAEGK